MTPLDIDRIRQVGDFESLVAFLRDELEWPLEAEDIEDLSFDYEPEELGISQEAAVKINYIKQLRPLAQNQPWGIFYIDFEPKKLPVVVLRRVLQKLVVKKHPGSQKSNLPGWHSNDLLFINSFGQQDQREITFAHFKQEENNRSTLKVIGWDGQDTPLHLDRCQNELGHLRFDPELDADQWRNHWAAAFTTVHRHTISTSKKLAQRLAALGKAVRINAEHILKYETESGRFKQAMAKFKTALIHDLTEDDFADMYAQTICYGLLYTAIRSHVSGETNQVSAERVQQLVLPTNPFLKEVMEDFFNIGSRKWDSNKEIITGVDFDELGVNEIIITLKDEKTDFDAILRDFGNKNPNEDPVIHFYELFLKEYDALKRKSRGVYYTPQPVVSFIVRSVHEILKRDFNLPLGLADTTTWGEMIKKNHDIKLPDGVSKDDFFVQILDPAVGTGTFLVETIDTIAITMKIKWGKELGLSVPAYPKDVVSWKHPQVLKRWNNYVPQRLLPRLYGFELMMAPYAIAHMKIGIKLFETGYSHFAEDKQRVRVYLTNTLEEAVDTTGYLNTLDPAMAEETRQANKIKEKNSITVVIGNPPYAGHSYNASKIVRYIDSGQSYDTFSRKQNRYITKIAGPKGAKEEKITWIGKLIQPYFFVDGESLGERNPKWLNDDYVKFIRYSQYRIDSTGMGVFGFITNHAYIDNPTFRGMRQSLMSTYSKINIIDLHGNSKKKEKSPDGSKDENVFEIQQGVAMNIAAKLPCETQNYIHSHIWGTREIKFSLCKNNTISSLDDLNQLNPISDMYLFFPQQQNVRDEYNKYNIITDVLQENSVGIVTARDDLTIKYDPEDVWKTVTNFVELDPETARESYQLGLDVRDWKVVFAQDDIKNSGPNKNNISPITYRPFENRWTYYTGKSRGFICMPRSKVMRHMIAGKNLGMIITRQTKDKWDIFCSANIIGHKACSAYDINNLFPLYLYAIEGELNFSESQWPASKDGRTPNLDPEIVNKFANAIGFEFVSDGKGNLLGPRAGGNDKRGTFGPEDIFHYIYAVFYSPTYRSRYAEFLKIDFPRVPLISDTELFGKLVHLGSELVGLHLMKSDKLNKHITSFPIKGDNVVSKVGETKKQLKDVKDGKGKLYINKTQYFANLSEEVWNFHIGGYQVCYKWLYDRKKAGRKLSEKDIDHYQKIVVALSETIRIMAEIDKVIDQHGGWPDAFVTKKDISNEST